MTEEHEVDQSGVELAYASLAVFADDGTIDLGELNFVLGIALRDGKISDSEREVLRSLFDRVLEPSVTAEVWKRLKAVRKLHRI